MKASRRGGLGPRATGCILLARTLATLLLPGAHAGLADTFTIHDADLASREPDAAGVRSDLDPIFGMIGSMGVLSAVESRVLGSSEAPPPNLVAETGVASTMTLRWLEALDRQTIARHGEFHFRPRDRMLDVQSILDCSLESCSETDVFGERLLRLSGAPPSARIGIGEAKTAELQLGHRGLATEELNLLGIIMTREGRAPSSRDHMTAMRVDFEKD